MLLLENACKLSQIFDFVSLFAKDTVSSPKKWFLFFLAQYEVIKVYGAQIKFERRPWFYEENHLEVVVWIQLQGHKIAHCSHSCCLRHSIEWYEKVLTGLDRSITTVTTHIWLKISLCAQEMLRGKDEHAIAKSFSCLRLSCKGNLSTPSSCSILISLIVKG